MLNGFILSNKFFGFGLILCNSFIFTIYFIISSASGFGFYYKIKNRSKSHCCPAEPEVKIECFFSWTA